MGRYCVATEFGYTERTETDTRDGAPDLNACADDTVSSRRPELDYGAGKPLGLGAGRCGRAKAPKPDRCRS